jgi:hypothetical protein
MSAGGTIVVAGLNRQDEPKKQNRLSFVNLIALPCGPWSVAGIL